MASVLKKLQKRQRVSEKEDVVKQVEEDENSSASAEEQKDTNIEAKESSEGSDQGDKDDVIDLDPENDLRAFKDADPTSKDWKNRQRTLVICSRGIAGRMRHLVKDLTDMIPNTKMESKINRKDVGDVVDEMCFEKSCNNCMFFEQRK
jgi:ribosome biogenesis protein BRX1